MDRIRTEYDQWKVLKKNEILSGEVSNKDLIVKMLSESLSQITNYFNKSNSIRSRGSTKKKEKKKEKKNGHRKKSELSQEKCFI